MKPIQTWLDEYADSHRNADNKTLHRICVPLIVFATLGMIRVIPGGNPLVNACTLAIVLALVYYALLSWRLALGMVVALAATYAAIEVSYQTLAGWHAPAMVAVFVLAWIGQFVGHRIEGKKPSFFKDLQFLLIGPLWLLADLYRGLRLSIAPAEAAARG